MNRQIFALLILAVATLSVAQDQPAANQAPVQDNSGAQPAASDDKELPAPVLLGGESDSLAFSSELARSNYLRGGISVGSTYDDNASNTSTDRISDFSYSILPNIALDQTRARLHWTLSYFGGFTANQRLTAHNQGSHNLSGVLDYRLSPHMTLRLSDNFLDTTGLLQQFQNGIGTPVTGPINQPNPTLITPLAKNLNNTGTADWTYQFAANDMIGANGTFYISHFRDLPNTTAPLLDSSVDSGSVYYNHRFTPRSWTGITYKYQHMEFDPGSNVNITHSLLLTHSINLEHGLSLSFFAGPEYSTLDTQTVTMHVTPTVISFATVNNMSHQISGSGGGTFGWQGQLTSIKLEASRKVSDGGGLFGAVELTSFSGGIRRQIAKYSVLHLNAQYGRNEALATSNTSPTLTSATGGLGLEQQLGQKFMLNMDYARDYQTGLSTTSTSAINHNRGSISISYNFTRPLGR